MKQWSLSITSFLFFKSKNNNNKGRLLLPSTHIMFKFRKKQNNVKKIWVKLYHILSINDEKIFSINFLIFAKIKKWIHKNCSISQYELWTTWFYLPFWLIKRFFFWWKRKTKKWKSNRNAIIQTISKLETKTNTRTFWFMRKCVRKK